MNKDLIELYIYVLKYGWTIEKTIWNEHGVVVISRSPRYEKVILTTKLSFIQPAEK